jgi:hypothetical protein
LEPAKAAFVVSSSAEVRFDERVYDNFDRHEDLFAATAEDMGGPHDEVEIEGEHDPIDKGADLVNLTRDVSSDLFQGSVWRSASAWRQLASTLHDVTAIQPKEVDAVIQSRRDEASDRGDQQQQVDREVEVVSRHGAPARKP